VSSEAWLWVGVVASSLGIAAGLGIYLTAYLHDFPWNRR